MNPVQSRYILQFFLLILLQGLILNHILFLGYINPYAYIFFLLFIPLNINRLLELFLSFLLGISIDFFSDTGGVHAAACLIITYIRPIVLRLSFGIQHHIQNIKIDFTDFKKLWTYIIIMVFTHHIFLFSLEYFSINFIVEILKNTLFSGLFTTLLIYIIIHLTKDN